jgi:hypothetical protein
VVPSARGADRYTLTQLTVNGASDVAAAHSRCMRAQPGDMMGLEILPDLRGLSRNMVEGGRVERDQDAAPEFMRPWRC